jgi:dTMP kinase
VQTREPGGTLIGQSIRDLFAKPPPGEVLTIESEAFLVSAARAQHCAQVIGPRLNAGDWVLSDRFADSTRVYQGILGGLNLQFVETLIRESTFGIEPDLSFLLDCDPVLSRQRLKGREGASGVERYDDAAMTIHQNLRQGFLDLANQFAHRIVILDASQSQAKVFEAACQEIRARFSLE